MYQERARELAQGDDEEARLHALHKWIQAAEQSRDPAALAIAHMQMGLAYQQQVLAVEHHYDIVGYVLTAARQCHRV